MLGRSKRKTLKKGALHEVEVELVSLLFDKMKPANQRAAVVKSTDGKDTSHPHIGGSTKIKSDMQGRIYATLMEPDVKDSQGDFYSREEIQKACDHFAQDGMIGRNDVNHNMQPVNEFYVAESYILKTEDKEHFPDTRIGAWVQVLKCKDLLSELWQKVVKGNLNGVSIYGKAADHGDAATTAIKGELETLKALLTEWKNAADASENQTLIDALQKKITELEAKAQTSDATGEVAKALHDLTKEATELMKSTRKAISKSIHGEPGEGNTDEEVIVNGEKVVVKAAKIELYKGLADLDSGTRMNVLNDNSTGLFIDEIVGGKDDDTLTEITVAEINKDNELDVGLLDDLVLVNEDDGPPSEQAVSAAALSLNVGILNGHWSLSKTTAEHYREKKGEAAFGAYVEQGLAKKTGKAMKKLTFKGDRSSGNAALKGLDGVVKIATTNTNVTEIEYTDSINWLDTFAEALQTFSEDMLEEQDDFRIYISHANMVKLRHELSNRATPLGDKSLTMNSKGEVRYLGILVKGRLMASDHIIMGLPKFIIIGYRTDAEVKVEHHGNDFKYHWYVRLRAGITYVNGHVKVFKLVVAS